MRIAYLAHWNAGSESGVLKKIFGQVHEWSLRGNAAYLAVVTSTGSAFVRERASIAAKCRELGIELRIFEYGGFLDRFHAWQLAASSIQESTCDIVYYRFDLYSPAVHNLMRTKPVIMEVNTDDVAEFCLRPGPRCMFNRLTRRLLFRGVAGLVYVSSELPLSRHFRSLSKVPHVTIGNGISLADYPVLGGSGNSVPRLIFMGSAGKSWQGVDQIIVMAECFPEWRFDIVGLEPQDLGVVPPNVTLHGFLSRKDYEPLVAGADLGIGSLALHRNGMNEASTLKTREYLAYGLPIIIGYEDTDFREPVPFVLQLPNHEGNVAESKPIIEKFVQTWLGRRVCRESLRRIDNSYKELQRLAFFEEVLSHSEGVLGHRRLAAKKNRGLSSRYMVWWRRCWGAKT